MKLTFSGILHFSPIMYDIVAVYKCRGHSREKFQVTSLCQTLIYLNDFINIDILLLFQFLAKKKPVDNETYGDDRQT